jgi:hypothetical protein
MGYFFGSSEMSVGDAILDMTARIKEGLQAKTGWGRNEIMKLVDQAAMETMADTNKKKPAGRKPVEEEEEERPQARKPKGTMTAELPASLKPKKPAPKMVCQKTNASSNPPWDD